MPLLPLLIPVYLGQTALTLRYQPPVGLVTRFRAKHNQVIAVGADRPVAQGAEWIESEEVRARDAESIRTYVRATEIGQILTHPSGSQARKTIRDRKMLKRFDSKNEEIGGALTRLATDEELGR